MKKIDEKKMLRNRIGVIDFLIIGLLCIGVFFLFNRFDSGAITTASMTEEVIFVFEAKNVSPGFYEAIEIGSEVFNSIRNYYIGEVVDVTRKPLKVWTEDIVNGEFKIVEDPYRYTVHVTIRSEGINTDTSIYAGQELIKIGHIFPIKGRGFASNGVVISIEEVGHE